jgi:hypothetical protein
VEHIIQTDGLDYTSYNPNHLPKSFLGNLTVIYESPPLLFPENMTYLEREIERQKTREKDTERLLTNSLLKVLLILISLSFVLEV